MEIGGPVFDPSCHRTDVRTLMAEKYHQYIFLQFIKLARKGGKKEK